MGGSHVSRDEGRTCKDCPDPPAPGCRRCEACATLHNARERARRAKRRRQQRCQVCGADAVIVTGGVALATCAEHREYFRARASGLGYDT